MFLRFLFKHKKFLLVALLIVSLSFVAAENGDNEFRAWNELSYMFHSGFYPATISQADAFIEKYGRSSLIPDVQVLKGESLFMLGRYAEAVSCLEKTAVRNADAAYWLGRSRFAQKQYRDAAEAFFTSVSLAGENPQNTVLFRSTLVYSAFSLSNIGEKEQAVSILQYAMATYEMADDFIPSAALLFSLYQSLGRDESTVALYKQLEPSVSCFERNLREAVMLSAARSFYRTGDAHTSWQLFSSLTRTGSQTTMLEALQEAYVLSVEHSEFDISSLLNDVEARMAAYPEYRSEMWLRLGIASFGQNDFVRAMDFLDRADVTANREQRNLSAIYRSEILLEQGKPAEGIVILEAASFTGSAWYADTLVQLARCSAFSGNKRAAAAYVQKLEFALPDDTSPNADTVFWEMWAASQNSSWQAVLSLYALMPETIIHPEAAALYSNALMIAEPEDAAAVRAADELEQAGDIRNACVAFLHSGQYDRVIANTEGTEPGSDVSYLRGLALLTKGRWTEAAAALGTDSPWALYYTAYALYRSGDSENAYRLFTKFINENPVHKMSYEANFTAALCALQNGTPKLAVAPAERAGVVATSEALRIEAHLQCSLIYTELGRLEDAIKVLETDAASVSRTAVPLKYQLADLYAEAGRLQDADALLLKTEALLMGTQMAEETAFRRAELYYAREKWNEAASRFSQCRKTYPAGTAASRALYYNALCCENGGNTDSAILMYEACRTSENADQYVYSCMAHLIPLYRATGEVNTALRLAEQTVDEYPKEAALDGIPDMLPELKLLAEGADEKTARLLARFNESGGVSSAVGRSTGVELARQYLDLYSKWNQGIKLLEDIVAAIPSDAEYDDMMTGTLAYSLLGRSWRQTDELEKASQAYITAANYGAAVSDEDTAHALYCAAEAFDAAGKTGDARLVCTQMAGMYAASPWTARASALLGL